MPRYAVDGALSRVTVNARSNIHSTRTEWTALSGTIEVDPTDLAGKPAVAELQVDMTRYDAGDFLRNRKLRKDLEVERFPQASFRLVRLSDVAEKSGGGRFTASAVGVISWHGRELTVSADGEGTIGDDELRATARFEMDVRAFGVEPPRFLMFKVENVVAVDVLVVARRA